MSSRTYICLTCRWARRAEAAYGLKTGLRCRVCHESLWELDSCWRIPSKTDDNGWKDLSAKVARDADVFIPRRHRMGITRIANLDQQITALQNRPETERNTARLKKLHRERRETIKRYI